MSLINSYIHGLAAAARRPKLVALLWLVNVVFALPAFFLFRGAIAGTMGNSLAADGLLKKTDMNVILEFLASSGGVLGQVVTAVLVLVALHVLAYIFVFGGILNVLAPESRGQHLAPVFFGGGGRFYGRYFRLVIYSLGLWVPVFIIFMAANAVLRLATKDSVNGQLMMAASIARIVLFLFLAFFVEMILDYARIKIALLDSREVLRSLVGATRFVLSKPFKTVLLYYLLGLTGWAAFGAYFALHFAFSETTAAAVILAFLITQAFIVSRAWLRIAFLAAQKNFLETSNPLRADGP
jgi:hypothetical protein